ncbi:hypothetical protein SteCoe_15291 [Stentor coeruleus]|uniref:Uncharacterized protein n=1 Tax=Stentor coeruleus TaxID=5963 RepID=A0A1R2C450_9CILI|nr:hypothetical protein SteCoe_15291 [Stentor coeruleus]
MLLLIIIILSCSASPSVKKPIGSMYIYQNQKLSYYLYDYFEGYYLSFTTNSTEIYIQDNHSFHYINSLPYDNINKTWHNTHYSYITWNDLSCNYLIDFIGLDLYIYNIHPINKELEIISSYNLNVSINQVVLWQYLQETYILIQGRSDKNYIFIANFTSYNCSDTIFPEPQKLDMWDLYYAKSLSTCSVSGTYIIPFIAEYNYSYSTQALFIYNFSNPYKPNMIKSLNNNYIVDLESQFYPFRVALAANSPENMTIIVLCLNYGILYYNLTNGVFQENWPHILIKQYGTFYSMSLISNSYFSNIIGVPLVIIVGTTEGLIVLDFYARLVMFSIPGISSLETNATVIDAVFVENNYFIYLESNELMIVLDRETTKDYSYIINLEDNVENYTSNAKWTVINYYGSFAYIRSDPDGIKAYDIIIDQPMFIIKENIPSMTYYIKANNDFNEHCYNNMSITETDDLYRIQLCTGNICNANNVINIQVIFEGLKVKIPFYIYEYFSGWNMSFEADNEMHSDVYHLSVSDYEKFSPGESVKIRKLYIQIIPAVNYVLMQYDEGIDFFETDFETLIRNVPIKDIISVEIYNNLVYVLYSKHKNHLSINSPISTHEILIKDQCNMLTFCINYLICGGSNTLSFYTCNNTNCDFILSLSTFNYFKLNITSLTSLNIPSENDCNIYIISDYINLFILSLFKTLNNPIYANSLSYYLISPAYRIYVTSLCIYTFNNASMTIYSSKIDNETNIDLNDIIDRVFLLENFVYISTFHNELMIVDGLEIVFNMVYLNIQISNNCYYSSSWFSGDSSITGIICSNETGYFLTTYSSLCPQQNMNKPCEIPFVLEFSIEDPDNVDDYSFLYNVTFNAWNQIHLVPLYATFELLIFGQVIHYAKPSNNMTDISVYYDTGVDLTSILGGFTGNNLTYKMDINNQVINPEQSENDPLKVLPNVFQMNQYTSLNEIGSITYIANTPYIAIYDIHSNLIFLNSSDYHNLTQEMNVVGNISLSEYQDKLICTSFQYISTKHNNFLISAMCLWSYNFSYYWRSILGLSENSNIYFIILIQINSNFELVFYEAFQVPFQPSQLKAVSDNGSKIAILLVEYVIDNKDPIYKNNRIYRAEFIWHNNTLSLAGHEIIDMFSLGLNSFFVYSLDGYYRKYMHIVVADKWNGVLILFYENGKTRVFYSIPLDNDPIYTVGVSYKMIYTVSRSGVLTTYALYNSIPVFSNNRYPFANNISISTIPSFISLSNYYWPQFLIYSVLYDRQGFYLRLVSLENTALSFLIKDIEYSNREDICMSFCPISAVFINETSFAFVYNMSIVKYYYINNYELQVPIMTEFEYKKLKEKWTYTNFTFKIIGFNENNNVTTDYYNLKILEYKKSRNDEIDTPIWIFPIISIGILVILIVTVKVIYKLIFRRRLRVVVSDTERFTDDSIISIGSY